MQPECRKRILLISAGYPTPAAPLAGLAVADQAACLARHHHVTVLTPEIRTWQAFGRQSLAPSIERADRDGVEVWRIHQVVLPSLSALVPICRWRRPPDRSAELVHFCQAIQFALPLYIKAHGLPDVIHAHDTLPAGWAALSVTRPLGIPIILTENEGPFFRHLRSAVQRKHAAAALAGASRALATTPHLREDLQTFFPNLAVEVVKPVIRTDWFTPAPEVDRRDPYRFFCFAPTEPGSGLPLLLDAIRALLDASERRFEVVIGGDAAAPEILAPLLASPRMTRHCRLLGPLSREEIRTWMQTSDAFISPNIADRLNRTIGEAMACGKPVIATQGAGEEELVSAGAGRLVPPTDVPALASAMADFIHQRFAPESAAIRASVMNRFGPDAFVQQMQRIYEGVCQRTTATAA